MKEEIKDTRATGQIKGFPFQIIDAMLAEQHRQGNHMNVEVFQENVGANARYGGFTWSQSKEGHEFWGDVIHKMKFDLFFERYPK